MMQSTIAPAEGKLGVLMAGLGAVSTTFVAGVEAVRRGLDAMFGTDRWREDDKQEAVEAEPEETALVFEGRLADFYERRLQAADGSVGVKRIRLDFPGRDRTIFYLFLTTHDPTGALTLNEVLDNARLSEFRLRWNRQQDKFVRRKEAVGQQSLFDTTSLKSPPPSVTDRSPNIPRLSAAIYEAWKGRATTKKKVYRSLIDSEVYASEVDRALTQLKREKLAEFSSTKINDPIRFASKGGAP